MLMAPVACGDDDSVAGNGSSGNGGSGNGGSGNGGTGGTKATGSTSSTGAGGDAENGGQGMGGAATGGAAGGGGQAGERGGEGGANSGQAGLGGGGGDAEGGAGGMAPLTNIIGGGWASDGQSEGVDKAFDHKLNRKWVTYHQAAWIQYEFIVKPASIQSYALVSGGDAPARDPRSWVLLGNDSGPDGDDASDSEWTAPRHAQRPGPFRPAQHRVHVQRDDARSVQVLSLGA